MVPFTIKSVSLILRAFHRELAGWNPRQLRVDGVGDGLVCRRIRIRPVAKDARFQDHEEDHQDEHHDNRNEAPRLVTAMVVSIAGIRHRNVFLVRGFSCFLLLLVWTGDSAAAPLPHISHRSGL